MARLRQAPKGNALCIPQKPAFEKRCRAGSDPPRPKPPRILVRTLRHSSPLATMNPGGRDGVPISGTQGEETGLMVGRATGEHEWSR